MPIFEVQSEAGTFQIDAPNQNEALRAFNEMPAPENSISGSAKALGSGLVEGVTGLAGLPADALDLGARGIDAVAGSNLQAKTEPIAKNYGSTAIKSALESRIGELPKPQTTLEKYIHGIGSFAPAVIGGPESLLTKVATRVAAPAIASEAAGQLAEGTGYEPVARVAGALGGAAGASKIASALSATKVAAVPTIEDISKGKTALYNSPQIDAVRYSPQVVEKIADRIVDNLKREYLDAPQTYKLLDMMKTPMNGPAHSIEDLENIKRRLNDLKSAGGAEAEAARRAGVYIDNILPHMGKLPGAVMSGNAAAAAKDMFAARKEAAIEFRNQKVIDALEKAKNTAAATHSGANVENEIYKQVRTMLNNPKVHLRGWTAEEKEALRAVLPGRGADTLRRAGKIMGGGGGLGQLASGSVGGAMFGWPGMAAVPMMGMAANKIGAAMATKRLNNVSEQLRSRSALYGPANQAARQQALSGGILAGLPKKEVLALQALLSARAQLPDYSSQQVR